MLCTILPEDVFNLVWFLSEAGLESWSSRPPASRWHHCTSPLSYCCVTEVEGVLFSGGTKGQENRKPGYFPFKAITGRKIWFKLCLLSSKERKLSSHSQVVQPGFIKSSPSRMNTLKIDSSFENLIFFIWDEKMLDYLQSKTWYNALCRVCTAILCKVLFLNNYKGDS